MDTRLQKEHRNRMPKPPRCASYNCIFHTVPPVYLFIHYIPANMTEETIGRYVTACQHFPNSRQVFPSPYHNYLTGIFHFVNEVGHPVFQNLIRQSEIDK